MCIQQSPWNTSSQVGRMPLMFISYNIFKRWKNNYCDS